MSKRPLLALISACLLATPAMADPFSSEGRSAWISLARTLIADSNQTSSNAVAYAGQLSDDCQGITGKVMGMHAPNAIGIQLQAFCMGVHDLNKEVSMQMRNNQPVVRGNPAYCGDFMQGINAAKKMPNTPDYADIYPVAQDLAAAALKVRASEFRFTPASDNSWGIKERTRLVTCR